MLRFLFVVGGLAAAILIISPDLLDQAADLAAREVREFGDGTLPPLFRSRLDGDAGCPELFSIRDTYTRESAETQRMDHELDRIGCHSSSSRRLVR